MARVTKKQKEDFPFLPLSETDLISEEEMSSKKEELPSEKEEEMSSSEGDSEDLISEEELPVTERNVDPPKRNLAGRYQTTCWIRFNSKDISPGTEVELSDSEARHYLKFGGIVSTEIL